MFCPKCGVQNPDDSKFCQGCGQLMSENGAENKTDDGFADASELFGGKKPETANTGYASAKDAAEDVSRDNNDFVDPDERVICTLGNGYWQNMVSGSIESSYAMLTQKRLYFCGRALEKNGKDWEKIRETKIVDIQDVRGTGFLYVSRVWNLVLSVFLFIVFIAMIIIVASYSNSIDENTRSILTALSFGALVAGIFFMNKYIMSRKSIFCIETAGGQIGFDVEWLNTEESVNFQRQIHLIKQKKLSERKDD